MRFFSGGAVLLLLWSCAFASAQELESVPLKELGTLSLRFERAERVAQWTAEERMAEVAILPGDGFSVRLPFVPNRLTPLVANGAGVEQGQPILRIEGPELRLWLLEAAQVEDNHRAATERFQRSKALFEREALSEALWLQVRDRYQQSLLEQHHVEHVLELLRPDAAETSAVVIAPRSGLVVFADFSGDAAPGAGELAIARLLAPGAVRYRIAVPAASAGSLKSLELDDCALAVAWADGVASGYRVNAWSEAATACAPARLGDYRPARPVYTLDGYRVSRSAVMRLRGQSTLALRNGDRLQLLPVSIVGSEPGAFFVRSPVSLEGAELLSQSMSALQGVLQILGSQ